MRWLDRLAANLATLVARGELGPLVIGPRASCTVAPPPRFAWDEKRWHARENGGTLALVGRYRVFDRRRSAWREFDGRVVADGGGIAAYVADPPPEVKLHRHGPCLQLARPPWFRLHWSSAPRTPDDALLYVERMLDEALNAGTREVAR
jgi:hypothetical protein